MNRVYSVLILLLALSVASPLAIAQVSANPSSFTVTVDAGTQTTKNLIITNTGASVPYATSIGKTTGGLWISRSPKTGTLPANGSVTLALIFDATSMLPGSYTSTLTVTPTGKPAVTVPLALVVKGLTFTALPGSATFKMTVADVRTQSLTVSSADSFTVGATSSVPWVTLNKATAPVASGAPATFLATIRPVGVTPGIYYVNIAFNSVGGTMAAPTQTAVLSVAVFSTEAFEATPANPAFSATANASSASPGSITVQLRNIGAACTYMMNVGQPWIKISKSTGSIPANGYDSFTVSTNAIGLTNGNYTGSVSISTIGRMAFTIPISLTVGSSTNLSLQPVSMSFNGTAGQATSLPATNSVTVTNSGSSVPYTVTPGASWLKVSKSSGTLPDNGTDTFQVSASPAALTEGTKTGTITVAAAGRPTRTLAVTFYVASAATDLTVSPGSLSLSGVEGSTSKSSPASVTVTNKGAAITYSIGKNAAWITVSKTTGSLAAYGTDSFTVSADLSALAAGTHNGTVTVSAMGRPSRTVAVSCVVTDSDDLTISPSTASFSGVAGSTTPAAPSTITLINKGSAVAYTVAKSAAWLTVSKTGGSLAANGTDSFTVTANPATLAAGSYTGTVTVTAPNRPTRTMTATFTVTGASDLTLSATKISFTGVAGQNFSGPSLSTVNVTNKGALVSYSITKIAPWLTVSKTTGVLAQNGTDSFTVSANPAALAAGSYSASITVTAPDRPARAITVTLTVSATEDLTFSPSSISLTGLTGEAASTPALPGIKLTNKGGQVNYSLVKSAPWIIISKTSGSVPQNGTNVFYLSANATALTAGVYNGTVTVTAAGRETKTLKVTFSVSDPTGSENLTISPASFTSAMALKGASPKATITVKNVGAAVSYSVVEQDRWLVSSKQYGSLPANGTDTFVVSFNLYGMSTGTYTGSLLIQSPSRPDRILTVELEVMPAALAPTSLTAFPPSLEFVDDGSRLTKAQSVQFFSADGTPVQVRIETESSGAVSLPDGSELSAPGAMEVTTANENGPVKTRLFVIPDDPAVEPIEIPVGIRQAEPALMSLPRIVDGGGFDTHVVLTNQDAVPARVSIQLFQGREDGETAPWPLVLDGSEGLDTIEIPVGGTVTLRSRGLLESADSGWGRVNSAQRISGYAILRRHSGDGEVLQTELPMNQDWQQRILLPFDGEEEAATAAALTNVSADEPAELTALFRNELGEAIGKPFTMHLPALGHQAFALADLQPEIRGLRGSLEVSARGGRLSSLGLRFTGSGMSSINVHAPVAKPPSPGPDQER